MNGRGFMVYSVLALAILFEIVGLTALKETHGFTRLLPAVLFAAGLGLSFYLESIALKSLPIGLTYTAWAGMGIVGMALVGALLYGEKINPGMMMGMALIIAGVAAMHFWTPVAEEEEAEDLRRAAVPVRVVSLGR